jgi:hypothetical protein
MGMIRDTIDTVRAVASVTRGDGGPPAPPPSATPTQQVDAYSKRLDHAKRTDSIQNLMTGLGSVNDKARAGVARWRQRMWSTDLETLYRFNPYAALLVDKLPDDATRKGWTFDPEDDEEKLRLEAEDERLRVPTRVNESIKWGRVYGGCVLLMVTDEDIPAEFADKEGLWLQTPLDIGRVNAVLSLIPLVCPDEAWPYRWDNDIRSGDFGEVNVWYLNPDTVHGAIEGMPTGTALVHSSRLVYFGGQKLPRHLRSRYNGYDDSVIERSWEAIQNITSADQAMAVLTQEIKTDVLTIDGLANLATSDDGENSLLRRLRQIAGSRSVLNATVLGAGEKWQSNTSPVTGFADLHDKAASGYSASSGMAKASIYGEAPGGLNTDGESHKDDWRMTVASWQEAVLRQKVEKLYRVVLGAKEGPYKGSPPEPLGLRFLPLDQPTEKAKADNLLKFAQGVGVLIQWGVLQPSEARQALVDSEALEGVDLEDQVGLVEPAPATEPPAQLPEPASDDDDDDDDDDDEVA